MGGARRQTPDLRIGCCGFPEALPLYAKSLPVVEVQQTFYQPPQLKTLENWRRRVPPEFEFTLKAWQLITHESSSPTYRRLREKLGEKQRREAGAFRPSDVVMNAWQRTLECARAVGSRVILFQCPARFTPTDEHKSNLQTFFREIRKGIGREFVFAWEPRGNWPPEEVRTLCRELGLVHAVDPFQHAPLTQGLGYLRLHGKTGYHSRYTDADLRYLIETARPFAPGYVLFNNLSMLEDAQRLARLARPPSPTT